MISPENQGHTPLQGSSPKHKVRISQSCIHKAQKILQLDLNSLNWTFQPDSVDVSEYSDRSICCYAASLMSDSWFLWIFSSYAIHGVEHSDQGGSFLFRKIVHDRLNTSSYCPSFQCMFSASRPGHGKWKLSYTLQRTHTSHANLWSLW